MRSVFDKIIDLEGTPSLTKHDQIVQGIINAIDDKIIVQSDPLPSVNKMIAEIGFARETVMKAFRELLSRGIIESQNRRGYFVANVNTNQKIKVALLMFAMDTFQELFYRAFRKELGSNVQMDVFFHHGNIDVFENIINFTKGKYGKYVISPIPHPKTKEILEGIGRQKFIMIDRYEHLDGEFNYVTQEFGDSSYNAFTELLPRIREFNEMIFYHEPGSLVPIEIVQSYLKFVKVNKINGIILPVYTIGSIQKGKIYYTNDNSQLWQIIKDCNEKNYQLGIDVGILSHNDEPVKEIIAGGITTYSTDFSMMGQRAAQAVMNNEAIKEVIPTKLIRRNSL